MNISKLLLLSGSHFIPVLLDGRLPKGVNIPGRPGHNKLLLSFSMVRMMHISLEPGRTHTINTILN